MCHDELEREREAHRLCSELNRFVDIRDTLRLTLTRVRQLTGCAAVGLRLEKDGDYPYYVQEGFSDSFVLREYSLCPTLDPEASARPAECHAVPSDASHTQSAAVGAPGEMSVHPAVPQLECMCGRLLSGLPVGGPDNATPHGSFYTNDSLQLAESADPESFGVNPRYACMRSGYASIALIPVKGPEGVLGLLQVNDLRKNFFDMTMLSFLEMIGRDVGAAVYRSHEHDRLQMLARDCAGMSERIRMTERFLGQLGRLLRQPLGSMNAALGQLAASPLSDTQAQLAASALAAVASLDGLSENLLVSMHASTSEGDTPREPFRVGELLRWIEMSFCGKAAAKGLRVRIEQNAALSETVVGELEPIRRILCILVDNAIRYTHDGSIRIVASVTLRHRSVIRIRFLVADTGPGLPTALRADPFRPFAVLETPACHAAGAGLGLSIAKNLATRMGGVLRHEPQTNGGTAFSLEALLQLPDTVGGADDAREAELLASLDRVSGQHILLVEDDPVNARVMAGYLSQGGLMVHRAPNARECMDLLSRYRMDAILMDIGLPEMDGLDLTRMIRRMEVEGERVPIIAVTGRTGPQDRKRCLDAGMDGYLPKPVRIGELVSMLTEALSPS